MEKVNDYNTAVGICAGDKLTDEHHVILLGDHAQAKHNYEFVLRLDSGVEFRTIMTHEEWEVVRAVIFRTMEPWADVRKKENEMPTKTEIENTALLRAMQIKSTFGSDSITDTTTGSESK